MRVGVGSFLIVLLSVLIFTANTNAILIDNGNGTITDTDRNLMWLQDANYAKTSGYHSTGRMTSLDAMSWADALVFGGYDDWRLPVLGNNNCAGWDCADSEMGHIYFSELGNIGQYQFTPYGTDTPGWGLNNTGSFANIQNTRYWTSTDDGYGHGKKWIFGMGDGIQDWQSRTTNYAWAVRDITVAPEPISTILFITGGTLLAGRTYIKRKKKA